MLLTQMVQRQLGPRQLAALERIDAEDFSGVRRKVAEELGKQGRFVDSEYLDAGVLALKLYYALPVIDPLNMHAVSDELDPFWHMHILHTTQYALFCKESVGSFMHHDPLDHARLADVARVRFLYGYTLDVLREAFGELDPRFYPSHLSDEHLVCTHGQDVYDATSDPFAIILPRVVAAQAGAVHSGH